MYFPDFGFIQLSPSLELGIPITINLRDVLTDCNLLFLNYRIYMYLGDQAFGEWLETGNDAFFNSAWSYWTSGWRLFDIYTDNCIRWHITFTPNNVA
jgi:hypothetical protein